MKNKNVLVVTEWCSGQARWAHNPLKSSGALEGDSVLRIDPSREEDVVHPILRRVFRRRCRDVLVSPIQTFGASHV